MSSEIYHFISCHTAVNKTLNAKTAAAATTTINKTYSENQTKNCIWTDTLDTFRLTVGIFIN